MNLNDFEKAVTGSRLKKAPFDKAFTDCFLNPLQFVPVKTVDTEVEENVKQTDTDIDEYTRMIRVRSGIINAQLKILLKESEQSTRETTANLGIPVSSTNNSDSSDTSDDSIDEKPRACLSARVDKGLKWPLLLNKWEAHFRSNDLFADNGELNSDLLERVFGSTDCSDWLSRMCCSNIKPNISAKTIVQENSKASLTVASITNSMSVPYL